MGCIKNDDRSDETVRREEREIENVMIEHPEFTFDQAWDFAIQQMRLRREEAKKRRNERLRNSLFGDLLT